MRTGKLRQRVTVKGYSAVSDGAGGTTTTDITLKTTWASIQPINARRSLENGQIIEGQYYSILLRHDPGLDLDKSESIDYKGRRIVIHSVIDRDERHKVIEVLGYEEQ